MGRLLLNVPIATFHVIASEVVKLLHVGRIHAWEVEIMPGLGGIDVSYAGDGHAGCDEG